MIKVWQRADFTAVREELEAVMWIVMEHKCVFFRADGTIGEILGKPGKTMSGDLGPMWERVV